MTTATALQVRVAETFLSLQGEGPSLGHPAHFLRLQGCSVGCRWCDTKYTWRFEEGEARSLQAIQDELVSLGHADLLVVTGGEPLEMPALPALLDWVSSRWARVEVETSGLHTPPPAPPNLTWNWSPKLSSVTPKADETWAQGEAFRQSHSYVCKVVVDTREDWEEAVSRLESMALPPELTYIMPQGMRVEELRERAQWIAPLCIARGYRLTPRMHVDIWGARRGV